MKTCIDCNNKLGPRNKSGRCGHHQYKWYNRKPITPRAASHRIVTLAVKAGIIKRASDMTCADCGCSATEYDHRDYMKPLDVDPVCRKCNRNRGAALNSETDGGLHADSRRKRQGGLLFY